MLVLVSPTKTFDCVNCLDTGQTTTIRRGVRRTEPCKACCPHDDIYKLICSECHKEFEPTDFYNEGAGLER